jgi:ERCC4-type nuclease
MPPASRPYHIKIDNREKALADFLQKDGYAFDIEPLEIGDIQFVDQTTKIPFIIVERKTYPDLEASIKDGRYKEQKERMLKAYPYKVRKIILLEGSPKSFKLGQKVLNGVLVNSMIRDHISIYCCRDFAEICVFFETILLNLPKYADEIIPAICTITVENAIPTFESDLAAYTHSVKTGKKENLTPKICFRNMLCQIPGISNTIADALVERYHSIHLLMADLQSRFGDDQGAMSKYLGEQKFGGGNGRKVGIVAENIVSHLFYKPSDLTTMTSPEESKTPPPPVPPVPPVPPTPASKPVSKARSKPVSSKPKKEAIDLTSIFTE